MRAIRLFLLCFAGFSVWMGLAMRVPANEARLYYEPTLSLFVPATHEEKISAAWVRLEDLGPAAAQEAKRLAQATGQENNVPIKFEDPTPERLARLPVAKAAEISDVPEPPDGSGTVDTKAGFYRPPATVTKSTRWEWIPLFKAKVYATHFWGAAAFLSLFGALVLKRKVPAPTSNPD